MTSANRSGASTKDKRKSTMTNGASAAKLSLTIVLKVSPEQLRKVTDATSSHHDAPGSSQRTGDSGEMTQLPVSSELKSSHSPPESGSFAVQASQSSDGVADSGPTTPGGGTPAPQPNVMGPPSEPSKKKGLKRAAGSTEPKSRSKPGPKKKQKFDDGIDGGRPNGTGGSHKLGPKASLGAINAGLRALDRSGKPCRKWSRQGFQLKTFTGVVWQIPRWTAPPRLKPDTSTDNSTTPSANGSSKENKDDMGLTKSENSHNGVGVEMSSASTSIPSQSPAPVPVAAAS